MEKKRGARLAIHCREEKERRARDIRARNGHKERGREKGGLSAPGGKKKGPATGR